MKSIDPHREALDQALRIALGTSQPALRRQALQRAATHLVHPRLVLESPLLTDSHPWRREALAVSDAFEAVTNGMEEAGVLEALDEIGADSPFQPWRQLILAIHFYYEGLDEAVAAHTSAIPADSPVRIVADTLDQLCGDSQRLPVAARRLADLLSQPDPLTRQNVQDIAEGLETENEPLFWGAFTDWLEALSPRNPERARSAVLWAWNQLEWREFDEAVLLDLSASLWGRAEACRLAALGSLPWDPEGAALLWARFTVTLSREGAESDVLGEALQWMEKFRQAAETQEPDREWWSAWHSLEQALGNEPAAPAPSSVPVRGQLDLFA